MANMQVEKKKDEFIIKLKSYLNNICDIPESFPVLDEYLVGLTQEEFCMTFRELKDIIMGIYEDLSVSPERLVIDNNYTTSSKPDIIFKFIYVTGIVSEIEGILLIADRTQFMNAFMTFWGKTNTQLDKKIKEFDKEQQDKFYKTEIKALFHCLKGFGFRIEEQENKIIVSYPRNPAIMKVIKSFAKHRFFRAGYIYDYRKFNYRVFATASDAKVPLTDFYSFQLLNDEHKKYLLTLDEKLAEMKIRYGETVESWGWGTNPCKYVYNAKISVHQNMEEGLIPHIDIDRKTYDLEKVLEYYLTIPEEIGVKVKTCNRCGAGGENPECGNCAQVVVRGKNINMCKIGSWFFPPTSEALPYFLDAYEKL